MLTVHRLQSAAEAAAYYSETDDYRREDGRAPTEWIGRGAEYLGLRGEIDPATVEQMLKGQLPDGTALGKKHQGEVIHAPGWDCTFSAPKSVSVAALVNGDERLVAAHDAAVREALGYIEQHAAATRIRTGGEVETVQTDNLIGATYRHTTNREQEPQLHTHSVLINATRDNEGRWRSFESRGLYRLQLEAGEIYRAALASRCQAAGYKIEHDPAGNGGPTAFRLANISRELEAAFSSRSRAVESELARMGVTRANASPEQKQAAALATRDRKEIRDHAELRAGWQVTGRTMGAGPEVHPQAEPAAAKAATEQAAAKAVRDAAAHLAEREARFTGRSLEIEAVRLAEGRAGLAEIRAAREAAEARGELVARETRVFNVATGQKEQGAGLTTREGIETEARMLAAARARPKVPALMKEPQAAALIRTMEQREGAHAFNEAQRRATLAVLDGEQRVTLVQGYAGTAKTTSVLAAVTEAAQLRAEREAIARRIEAASRVLEDPKASHAAKDRAGIELRDAKIADEMTRERACKVIALAPTNSAAETLGNAIGAKGQTVASYLAKGERADAGTVLIVDEASMLSAKDTARLMEAAKAGRVVLVGDVKQLGSVEAGAAFRQLQESGTRTVVLDEIVRQRDEQLRAAVYDTIRGDAKAALDKAQVIQLDTRSERVAAMADAYTGLDAKARAETLVIAPGRDDRAELNAAIRERLAERGEVDRGGERTVTALERKDLTEITARRIHSYQAGDVLEAARAYATKGLRQGDRLTVREVDTQRGRLICETQGSRTVELDPRRHTKLRAYEAAPLQVAPGDTLTLRAPDRKAGLKNGDRVRVEKVGEEHITVRTEHGKKLKLDTRAGLVASHGYAQTAHESQGRTCERVLMHAESSRVNLMNQQAAYVGLSRAKSEAIVFTDDKDRLAAQIERESGQKETAQLSAGEQAPVGQLEHQPESPALAGLEAQPTHDPYEPAPGPALPEAPAVADQRQQPGEPDLGSEVGGATGGLEHDHEHDRGEPNHGGYELAIER